MPYYSYRCLKCHKEVDVKHGFDEIPPTCACGNDLTIVYKPATIIFRVSGFYLTDKSPVV